MARLGINALAGSCGNGEHNSQKKEDDLKGLHEELAAIGRSLLRIADLIESAYEPKVEAPKVEAPKVEAPKVEAPKVEAPKVEAPKVEAPKVEAPKVEAPKVEAPKVEAPKVEAPKVEAPKVEAPKVTRELLASLITGSGQPKVLARSVVVGILGEFNANSLNAVSIDDYAALAQRLQAEYRKE